MKTRICTSLLLLLFVSLLSGCVSIPPLIQVQHKEDNSNQEIIRRLDAIDRRLDKLEHADHK